MPRSVRNFSRWQKGGHGWRFRPATSQGSFQESPAVLRWQNVTGNPFWEFGWLFFLASSENCSSLLKRRREVETTFPKSWHKMSPFSDVHLRWKKGESSWTVMILCLIWTCKSWWWFCPTINPELILALKWSAFSDGWCSLSWITAQLYMSNTFVQKKSMENSMVKVRLFSISSPQSQS